MKRLFVIFFGWLLSCDPVDDRLTVVNSTDEKIYFMRSPYSDLSRMYSETVKQQGTNLNYLNFIDEVESGSTKELLITGGGNAWERYINKACEDEKLRFYIFHIDTLKKYSWKEVIEGNRYISKGEYSVEELEKVNWQIKLK